MTTDWFAGAVAERYDENTADLPVEPVVEFLVPLGASSVSAVSSRRMSGTAATAPKPPTRSCTPPSPPGSSA